MKVENNTYNSEGDTDYSEFEESDYIDSDEDSDKDKPVKPQKEIGTCSMMTQAQAKKEAQTPLRPRMLTPAPNQIKEITIR